MSKDTINYGTAIGGLMALYAGYKIMKEFKNPLVIIAAGQLIHDGVHDFIRAAKQIIEDE